MKYVGVYTSPVSDSTPASAAVAEDAEECVVVSPIPAAVAIDGLSVSSVHYKQPHSLKQQDGLVEVEDAAELGQCRIGCGSL